MSVNQHLTIHELLHEVSISCGSW